MKSYIRLLDKPKMNIVVIPKDLVDKIGGLGTRLLCSVNEFPSFHCGMVAFGTGQGYISINKKTLKAFSLDLGDEVSLELRYNHSKYGMEMPEELDALLEQDMEGADFESLNDGKKSQLKGEKFDFRYLLGMPPRKNC
ncbi:MAG: DUF1905 domain-containing protein [Balneola sp.]